MPVLTIFAGPNGSGKSSIILRVDFAGRNNLLEADAIASRIYRSAPQLAAMAQVRRISTEPRNKSVAARILRLERTLSGNWTARAIKGALQRRFVVRLLYICVGSPEKSIQRVQERVARGGHYVPVDGVRRRYARSLSNAKQILGIVDEAVIYDNSGPEPKLILEIRFGKVVSMTGELPKWASDLIAPSGSSEEAEPYWYQARPPRCRFRFGRIKHAVSGVRYRCKLPMIWAVQARKLEENASA